jgi:hypothetical protein
MTELQSRPTGTTTAVDRFLAGVLAGAIGDDVHAGDAHLDATVPGWRFQVEGATGIRTEYARWFDQPSRFEALERHPLPDGEVVRYLQVLDDGTTVHHVHLLSVRDDRIVLDRVFCGGRWNGEALAQMGAGAHAG